MRSTFKPVHELGHDPLGKHAGLSLEQVIPWHAPGTVSIPILRDRPVLGRAVGPLK